MSTADNTNTLLEAKRALSQGENFLAYDIAERIPDDASGPSPQKIWIMALALARSGSLRRARELTESLPDSDDVDIAGLKSRIYKDLAFAESDPELRRVFYLEAANRSLLIFGKKHAWYNGINAASCLYMAGDIKRARELVTNEILPLCESETQKDMWLEATLGECYALLTDYSQAAQHYSRAAEMALRDGSFGDFSSTLRQLKMLSSTIPNGAEKLWSQIALPSICVFSGHRIDPPNSTSPRFPIAAEPFVRERLLASICKNKISLGYASCANGGDIIFLESILETGGHVWVVPPFSLETTIRLSVANPVGNWEKRLRAIIDNPRTTLIDPECDVTGEEDDVAYDFTNRYVLGLARLKSSILNLPLCGLALWDGTSSSNIGNTYSAIRLWEDAGIKYESIKPEVRT